MADENKDKPSKEERQVNKAERQAKKAGRQAKRAEREAKIAALSPGQRLKREARIANKKAALDEDG